MTIAHISVVFNLHFQESFLSLILFCKGYNNNNNSNNNNNNKQQRKWKDVKLYYLVHNVLTANCFGMQNTAAML